MEKVFVLLVDDEPAFLQAMKDYLDDTSGFAIECTSSPEKALEKIKTDRYHVVVSDYSMPEMNGVELLKSIRTYTQLPFILLTGMDDRQIIDDAIMNDVDFYLEKGEDPGILFPRLTEMITVCALRKKISITG